MRYATLAVSILLAAFTTAGADASSAPTTTAAAVQTGPPPSTEAPDLSRAARVSCASKPGERNHCPANTAQGVVLARSFGEAPCLLGKTWGYDDQGIWVSDGCTAEFIVAAAAPGEAAAPTKQKAPEYVPNVGFLLYEGEYGQIYMRLFTYVRYLNQKLLDEDYTDSFGTPKTVDVREDVQLNKFFLPFTGWFLTPQFRYYLYVWSTNASQGDPAQVVGAGNISYNFNRFVTLGGGITSLPSTRSTEGQFPYWLGVDDRLIADEFFRGSYTTGVWIKGELHTKLKYMAMIANNLSTLGVSASQLDNELDTRSVSLQWLPTTGEFGLYGTFGDYDYHDKVATRLGVHFTHSLEDNQSQPGTDDIENSQIRLTDGNVIFTPDLFAPGVTVERVTYEMASIDAGIKYKGFSVEAEYYWRWLNEFSGINTGGIEDIDDHGYQAQVSAMVVPAYVQAYAGLSEIFGDFGDASEIRAGVNWYVMGKRGLRFNTEWIRLNDCPVGYTAVPYPVGGNGDIYHVNFEMNF